MSAPQSSKFQVIKNHLDKQREKLLVELKSLNFAIQKKNENIERMRAYHAEYQNDTKFALTRAHPSLEKNKDLFINRILTAIVQSETELGYLNANKKQLLTQIEVLKGKIDTMQDYLKKGLAAAARKEEKLEQTALDDLTLRGRHG